MAKRGPKKKLNMVRKWWRMHEITAAQLERLVEECKLQLPLLADKLDQPLIIAAMVCREAKQLDEGLFDANDLMKHFKIEVEYEPRPEPGPETETLARGVDAGERSTGEVQQRSSGSTGP